MEGVEGEGLEGLTCDKDEGDKGDAVEDVGHDDDSAWRRRDQDGERERERLE